MPWRGPEYEGEKPSLGPEVVAWMEEHLRVPSGPLYGEPFVCTDEQYSFFVRFYQMNPQGRFLTRRAVRRGAKGKGKSPEGAAWLLAEFDGPVVFDGWDAQGEPVGRPRDFPWCQVVACSEEQTGNLYHTLREMAADSDLTDHIQLGKTKIQFADGRPGFIEPVSASAGAREGQLVTAAVMEETHLWFPTTGGHKLAAVLKRNLAKTGGRSLEVTNAPALGERSVAELTLEDADRGQEGLLYDCVEAPWIEDPKDPEARQAVIDALEVTYGEASTTQGGWVDLERLYDEVMDGSVTVDEVRRFYFNQAVKSANRAYNPTEWRACADTERVVDDDEPVILMFDGARTRDCAVFTAWTIGDVPHHFEVKVWVRPDSAGDDYEHPRGEMRRAAREFIDSHNVILFVYDSSFHELSSLYDEWVDEWGEYDGKKAGLMVEYPTATGKRMDAAIRRFQEDLHEQLFTHDGSDTVTAHIENSVLDTNRGGWLCLMKEKDSLKIDAAVTATFGYDVVPAARDALALKSKTLTPFIEVIG